MTTTMVHVRVRKDIKDKAQKTAKRLGVSLSAVVEQAFRHLVDTQELVLREWPKRK